MWADDQPAHPMSYFAHVVYSGRLNESALVRALEQTLPRHPLLHARIVGTREKDLTWVPSPDLMPYLDCADAPTPMRFPGGYRIELREENGLRIWVRKCADGGVIRLQFHHACCDGDRRESIHRGVAPRVRPRGGRRHRRPGGFANRGFHAAAAPKSVWRELVGLAGPPRRRFVGHSHRAAHLLAGPADTPADARRMRRTRNRPGVSFRIS